MAFAWSVLSVISVSWFIADKTAFVFERVISMSHRTQSLIKMINQIADHTSLKDGEENAAEVVASHIQKFWAQPMRADIKNYLESDGSELNALAAKAVRLL